MPPDARRAFPTGGIVPEGDLVGRETAIRNLISRLYDQKSSVYITGLRQIGKTSVLIEVLSRIRKKGGRAVYLDCSVAVDVPTFAAALAAATYDEKAQSAGALARLRAALSGVRPTLAHPDSGLVLTLFGTNAVSPERQLEKALRMADEFAVADKKRTVVVFDEFQRLGDLDPKLFDQVRANLQQSVKNTTYVFMGSQVGMLRALFTKKENMLYRLASPFDIPIPDAIQWRTYIEKRFRGWKLRLRAGEAERMVQLTGGHPRDLMELCRALLDLRLAGSPDSADLEVALEKTLATLAVAFDQIWQTLAEPKGTRLTAERIATGQPPYKGRPRKTVERTIERLEKDGLITRAARGQYAFSEQLFAVWLQRLIA